MGRSGTQPGSAHWGNAPLAYGASLFARQQPQFEWGSEEQAQAFQQGARTPVSFVMNAFQGRTNLVGPNRRRVMQAISASKNKQAQGAGVSSARQSGLANLNL